MQAVALKKQPIIFGIVNITPDSFSDGGAFFQPENALKHTHKLINDGAEVIDIGGASSHPNATKISPQQEIKRLEPLLAALTERKEKWSLSIDSHQTEVQRYALKHNVGYLNDTSAFDDKDFYNELADVEAKLILMHSIQRQGYATREKMEAQAVYQQMIEFFEIRLEEMMQGGIAKHRFILDPGMGFFLGLDPQNSVYMLLKLKQLQAYFGLPLMVSVSRKSFIGAITGSDVSRRGPASLIAELFAWQQGVQYIRTHDVAALRDACLIWSQLFSV